MTTQDWQRGIKDCSSAFKHLFDSKDVSTCDASFEVINANGHPETVHAHRVLLATRSPVFYAMFYGPLADSKMPVKVEDVTADTFKMMLRYIYKSDLTCVNSSNVLAALCAAHKYDIEPYREYCSAFAAQKLTVDTVFDVIKQADLLNDHALTKACYAFVDINTTKVMYSKQFLDQSDKVVKNILQRATLAEDGIPEKCIYNAVVRWASVRANAYRATAELSSIGLALGGVRHLVRFPLLKPTDIFEAKKQGILSSGESADLLAWLHKVPGVTTQFVEDERTGRKKAFAASVIAKSCVTCKGTGSVKLITGSGIITKECSVCRGKGKLHSSAVPTL